MWNTIMKIVKKDKKMISNKTMRELGIEIDDNLSEFNKNINSYQKIDINLVGKLDNLMQMFPAVVNLQNNKDAYRAIYDKGLGALQKVAQNGRGVRGNIVNGVNNKIVGQAIFEPLSNTPQIIGGLFSVMSIITGQYFMAQINGSLKKIEKGIANIQKFLENDKKSKLQGNEEFLKNIQKTLSYILENEMQQQATITSIQNIKRDSLQAIKFYKNQINELKDISKEKDKAEEILKNIEEKCKLISEYWYSLYLYCFATYLEPIVSQNYNEDYLKQSTKEIIEKCETYKVQHQKWSEKLKEYVYNSKALNDNIAFFIMKQMLGSDVAFGVVNPFFLVKNAIGMIGHVAYKIDKNNKEKQKDEAQKIMGEILNTGNDIKEIEALTLFDKLNNGRIELIKQNDEMYIKLLK